MRRHFRCWPALTGTPRSPQNSTRRELGIIKNPVEPRVWHTYDSTVSRSSYGYMIIKTRVAGYRNRRCPEARAGLITPIRSAGYLTRSRLAVAKLCMVVEATMREVAPFHRSGGSLTALKEDSHNFT